MTKNVPDKKYNMPSIASEKEDHLAKVLRGLVNAVPIGGGALAEIITSVIPNQRDERFAQYLEILAKRVEELEVKDIREEMRIPENIDLFERGARQAVLSLTEDRMKYIVECVSNGISERKKEIIHYNRILRLLEELDDEEIMILYAYEIYNNKRDKASDILNNLKPAHGYSTEDHRKNTMWEAAHDNLGRLSLLKDSQKTREITVESRGRTEKIRVLELDTFEIKNWESTHLATVFLKGIGLDV